MSNTIRGKEIGINVLSMFPLIQHVEQYIETDIIDFLDLNIPKQSCLKSAVTPFIYEWCGMVLHNMAKKLELWQ